MKTGVPMTVDCIGDITQRQAIAAPPGRRRLNLTLASLALGGMTLCGWLTFAGAAAAADARLSWTAVNDPRPITYELHYGPSATGFEQQLDTDAAFVVVPDLAQGEAYAFAVRACVTDAALCGEFSPSLVASVPYTAPEAGFTASPLSGPAPLRVVFSDQSSGNIDSLTWDFGDGTTASGARVEHRYLQPGSYTVALTARGPGGSDTQTRVDYVQVTPVEVDEALLEAGETLLTDNWQWIPFQRPWDDPVVVARPLSAEDDDPALVRIDGVSNDGFWARIQEWSYLDDRHADELLSWMVMNAGTVQSADGRWLEAGHISSTRRAFRWYQFSAPFAEPPVVLSAVTSNRDETPVISRLRSVTATAMQIGLREEEAADQRHASERIDYIAIEPGIGPIGDWLAEVGATPEAVTHHPYSLVFAQPTAEPPLLLAQMQTTNGGDTANLRWSFRSTDAVDVWVDEEQSRDSEVRHTREQVGYLLLSANGTTPTPPETQFVYEDAENGDTLGWSVYAGPGGASITNQTDPDVDGRVIVLEGAGWSNGYRLRREDGSPWADAEHRFLAWDLKYAEPFHVYVDIDTSIGQVYLEYTPVDERSTWVWENYVHHGVGTDVVDGRWHTFERDLVADLADAFPDAELLRVNAFLIRGSGRVDNIQMR